MHSSTFQGKTCYRCGSKQHMANFQKCPAKNAICNACKKKGHFAKVCRGHKNVSEISIPEVTVLMVESPYHDSSKIMCTVQITVCETKQNVELMLDTGSAVSIIPMSVCTQYFPNAILVKAKVNLVSYGGHAIPVMGCIEAEIMYGERRATAELFVVNTGTAVLGRDLFAALELQLLNGRIVTSSCRTINSADVSTNSEKLGCAQGFVNLVKIRAGVKPVQQKLHRLPFAVRDAVSQELKRLIQQDVIEPIESSEWVSPVVVTKKKNGNIRLCVDLREPNKAIVVDSFPLPHMEEMFAELRGSTVFSTLDFQSAYHQVLLHEDSRSLTSFITHEGLFRLL